MISVEKAKKLIVKHAIPLKPTMANIDDIAGSVVYEKVISPVNLPPFDQSAMDGYAILFSDYKKNKPIKIVGEVPAGKYFDKKIKPGEAVRIFTGAPVPAGTDTVVMQEKVTVENNFLLIQSQILSKGANIRKAGSQIKKGESALAKGSVITCGGIGYLAAMGISKIKTVSTPKVAVIVTGTELKKPGEKLGKGHIYESNSFALNAALKSVGVLVQNNYSVTDSESKTLEILKKVINNFDLIIITGGISVGDYDFVGEALEKLNVKNIFYKIRQKPGKPLFFGKKNNTLIFGLPGNPAAVLSCFYEYVYPALGIMQGKKDVFLKKVFLPILKDYSKKNGLSFFLKGKIMSTGVMPLEGQESYILSSFAMADCLIYLSEESQNIKKNDVVEVHLLPGLY